MAKSFIRGVAAVAVAFGGFVLAGCNTSCCTPCQPGPSVYKRPCCAILVTQWSLKNTQLFE